MDPSLYYFGDILLLPYTFAPDGTCRCDGRTLSIQAYNALYALIGTTYGGDGSTNFKIPNLIGTEPIKGLNYYIVLNGTFPDRQ
jgi:microcystin-dependent protein